MGDEGVPRVIDNNAYANFLGVKEAYYGNVQVVNGLFGQNV